MKDDLSVAENVGKRPGIADIHMEEHEIHNPQSLTTGVGVMVERLEKAGTDRVNSFGFASIFVPLAILAVLAAVASFFVGGREGKFIFDVPVLIGGLFVSCLSAILGSGKNH